MSGHYVYSIECAVGGREGPKGLRWVCVALALVLMLERRSVLFCSIISENYGQVLRDTSAALGLNPQSEKAFYRAARALHALDKNVEALDCCDHALLIDANNTAVKKLRERIVKRQVYLAKLEEERKERERRKNETERALKHAFLVSR